MILYKQVIVEIIIKKYQISVLYQNDENWSADPSTKPIIVVETK